MLLIDTGTPEAYTERVKREGLEAVNRVRTLQGAEPLDALPSDCVEGDWNRCALGRALGDSDLAQWATELDPALAALEECFESGLLPELSADAPGPVASSRPAGGVCVQAWFDEVTAGFARASEQIARFGAVYTATARIDDVTYDNVPVTMEAAESEFLAVANAP